MFFKTKPVLLLDIDGVFNALSKIDNRVLVPHDWGTWQISKENFEFLKKVSKYKCIWISTWAEESNQLNQFARIKDFDYFYNTNKETTVNILQKKYKNILIVDDEYYSSQLNCIKPNSDTGLNAEEREQILKFCTEVKK